MFFARRTGMIYKNFNNEIDLPMLGFGTMRLPTLDKKGCDLEGTAPAVDEEAFREMVDYAMAHGVNYFDTAWGYHDGNSEPAVGRALSARYDRSSFKLATKFPGYDIHNMTRAEEIFEKQLERCKVDYFDFYLLHNVCGYNINEYLDPKYGIAEYFLKQQKAGRIKYLGFSCHGNNDVLGRFLDKYHAIMQFCQLQVNWLDWTFRDAKSQVEMLRKYNMPLWVMEPLRGGKLVQLDEKYKKRFFEMSQEKPLVKWAFDFLRLIPETTVILSGMSSLDQMKENIEAFNDASLLSDTEQKLLSETAAELTKEMCVPCTKCRYCTAHCPQHLDIPNLIRIYNDMKMTEHRSIYGAVQMLEVARDKFPSACIGCRSCELVCPQGIKISEVMKNFSDILAEYQALIESRRS